MFQSLTESGPALLGKNGKLHGSFILNPSHSAIANTIRRCIISDVKTVGFRTEPPEKSEIIVERNTTPLTNEMLIHRIGMIPITADPDTYNSELYEFRLEVENTEKENRNVTADDIQVFERDTSGMDGSDGWIERADLKSKFFPPDPITDKTCLITILRPQWNPDMPPECIKLSGKATISSGSENIRWSPVSQCSYENTLDTNPERQEALFHNWVTVGKNLDMLTLEASRRAELSREYQTMEVQKCFLQDDYGEPVSFTFHLESVGVLTNKKIMLDGIQAARTLVSKYTQMGTSIPDNVTISRAQAHRFGMMVTFTNEGHTLGNLLQTYLVMNHINGTDPNTQPKINYAGYRVPHPLKKEMVVELGVEQKGVEAEKIVRDVIANVCNYLNEYFKELENDWVNLTPDQ